MSLSRSIELLRPGRQTAPVVFSSPHSGREYPPEFLSASGLDAMTLRKSEDAFVDLLFRGVVALGAPLLAARFPRAFVDPNREPYELDPEMFDGPLPAHVNKTSPRVAAGLGTIARVVARSTEIYRGKLSYRDAARRIDRCYRPYHAALSELVAETRRQFGFCVIIDCHSMPSSEAIPSAAVKPAGRNMAEARSGTGIDVVLGDALGRSCARALTDLVEGAFLSSGYSVRRNVPYAGGFITDHYGQPEAGLHTLQIELNRSLYMDEASLALLPRWREVARDLCGLAAHLAAVDGMRLQLAAPVRTPQTSAPMHHGEQARDQLFPFTEKRAAT